MLFKTTTTIIFILFHLTAKSQIIGIDSLSQKKRNIKTFESDYKISLPKLNLETYDKEYEHYFNYITNKVARTQSYLKFTNGFTSTIILRNAANPHAQLDTSTIIKNKSNLHGVWREVCHRRLKFVDSIRLKENQFYRIDSVQYSENPPDAFAQFKDNKYEVYTMNEAKKRFTKKYSSKYELENGRYLLLYKHFKSRSSTGQIGIDENGFLIINIINVTECFEKNVYTTYYAIIEQLIFEKVRN